MPYQKLRRDFFDEIARGERLGVHAGGLLGGSRIFAAGNLEVRLAGKIAGVLQAYFGRGADRKLPGPAAEAIAESPRGLPARENLKVKPADFAVRDSRREAPGLKFSIALTVSGFDARRVAAVLLYASWVMVRRLGL